MTEEQNRAALEELNDVIGRRDRFFYQRGFMVAVNFLYHHHETQADMVRPDEDKARFEEFLKLHVDEEVVQDAINIKSGDGDCNPGYCDVNGRCVLCKFIFAFDPKNFT